jgi:oligopeptide transport system substrate-binding protein
VPRPTARIGGSTRAAALAVGLALALPAPAAAESVIRLSITQDPPQLDSTKATDAVSGFVLGHVKEGLTRYGRTDAVVPGVADRWEIRADGATFFLRPEARWEDGRPVTAHDFVFGWRTLVDPKTASEYAFLMFPVKNAEAVNAGKLPPSALGAVARDDRTLEIVFERPCGYFLSLTAFPTYQPVRQDHYEARPGRYAASAEDLLSNGPYRLTHWAQGASLIMEKNPRYWDARRIQIDRIEIPYITSDANARFNLFRDGRVDVLESLGRDELKRAQAQRFKMKSFQDGTLYFLQFNFREGRITANRDLRKAIQLVFDPKEFVSRVIGVPGTRPGLSYIPHHMPGVEKAFRKEYPLDPVKPDLEAARAHVERARAALGGTIPPIHWLTGDTPGSAREAEYFQRLLNTRLGLDVRIDRQIFKQRLAKMRAGQFDVVSAGWRADYDDPMTYADLVASWNENNRGQYRNGRYDALVRRAQELVEPRARMDLMAAAERIANDDVALLPLYERAIVYVHSRRVEGIVRHVTGTDPDYTFARIRPETDAQASLRR